MNKVRNLESLEAFGRGDCDPSCDLGWKIT